MTLRDGIRNLVQSGRRLFFFGLGLGTALVLSLVAFVFITSWMDGRVSGKREWNSVVIAQGTVKTDLKTQFKGSSVEYQFSVEPVEENSNFDLVAKNSDNTFSVEFVDPSGFKVCESAIGALTPVVLDDGVIAQLSANDTFLGCNAADLKRAANWNVTYRFPKLTQAAVKQARVVAADWQDSLQVTCDQQKGLLSMILEKNPGLKEVSVSCSIRNGTTRSIPFGARPPRFNAILNLPDGDSVQMEKGIYLASQQTSIPPNTEIQGGLWVSHTCAISMSDELCFQEGTMEARELLLADLNTFVHYRVRFSTK